MNAAALHAIAALLVAAAALAAGSVSAFLAAPLVVLLALQGLAHVREPERAFPRRSVGLALGTVAFAGVPLLLGHPGWAVAVVATGLVLVTSAARQSLSLDPEVGQALVDRADWRLYAGVAADETLRLAAELRGALRTSPRYEAFAAEARIAAHRNAEEGWHARPERAYAIPPPLEKVRREPCRMRGLGNVEVLRFASDFEPQDPEVREAYLGVRANRTAHAVLLRHDSGPRPTLLYCHGYALGAPALDARMAGAARIHRELGVDVALFTLPLHGARAMSWMPGAGVLDDHPLWTNAALGQAVWDLRRLTGFLRSRGAPAIGVFGTSLGGYVASVFASVDPRLACVIAMNTPASLEDLFWQQLSPSESAAARAAGLTPHVLTRAWSRHAPLRMRPQVAHSRRLIVGGLADQVVPTQQTRELWDHWGRPAIHWFPGTHTVWLGLEPLRRRIEDHLRETLVALH